MSDNNLTPSRIVQGTLRWTEKSGKPGRGKTGGSVIERRPRHAFGHRGSVARRARDCSAGPRIRPREWLAMCVSHLRRDHVADGMGHPGKIVARARSNGSGTPIGRPCRTKRGGKGTLTIQKLQPLPAASERNPQSTPRPPQMSRRRRVGLALGLVLLLVLVALGVQAWRVVNAIVDAERVTVVPLPTRETQIAFGDVKQTPPTATVA